MYTKSDFIEKVTNVGYISGRLMPGYDEDWGVRGTDLGHPFYDPEIDRLLLAHGDTFNNEDPGTPILWRSNVISYKKNISDWDPAEGFTVDGYIPCYESGFAKSVIEGKHEGAGKEVTKIPRGGVVINGVYYLWYMSVGVWEPRWINNYSGVVKSTDRGRTWERVFDLTWFGTNSERAATAKALAQENVNGTNMGYAFNLAERAAPNFMQMFPVDGKDGYIYCYGIAEGIHCTGKLCRVTYEDIEIFDKYEYLTGYLSDGTPQWEKGKEGLAAVKDPDVGKVIDFDGDMYSAMGESCITYNKYLGKWIMLYHLGNAHIVFRMSDNVWGKWSRAYTILDLEDYPFPNGAERTYGGFSHEMLMKEDGRKMYILVSTWVPYNVCMMEVTFC
ncbi:MAG: DUF4185 domain-containing protein [Clostridia bacterium]|nr:DUF4185 domain-containing protein [Clostridia bacterium]